MSFSGVIAKVVAAAEKVKSGLVKAVQDVDGVVVKLAGDAPEIAAVVNAAVPGAGNFVTLGITALEQLASVLDAGGAAAESNLKNAGLDETFIAAIKAEIANIKKLV